MGKTAELRRRKTRRNSGGGEEEIWQGEKYREEGKQRVKKTKIKRTTGKKSQVSEYISGFAVKGKEEREKKRHG